MEKNKIHSNRKGQGAMEYLTTYGWAILVVMVVGMVLYQMGVFNTTSGSTFSDWFYLKPMAASVGYSNTGSFQSTFQNTVGTSIQILSASVYEKVSDAPCDVTQINSINLPAEISVSSGDVFTITSDCPERTQGEPYIASIAITYNAVARDMITEHTENGTISGVVE
jgi:hypothetical protein